MSVTVDLHHFQSSQCISKRAGARSAIQHAYTLFQILKQVHDIIDHLLNLVDTVVQAIHGLELLLMGLPLAAGSSLLLSKLQC